jgi:hypothetical protein
LLSFCLLAAFKTTKVKTNPYSRIHDKQYPLILISKIYEVPLPIFPSTLSWLIYIKGVDGVHSRRHKGSSSSAVITSIYSFHGISMMFFIRMPVYIVDDG